MPCQYLLFGWAHLSHHESITFACLRPCCLLFTLARYFIALDNGCRRLPHQGGAIIGLSIALFSISCASPNSAGHIAISGTVEALVAGLTAGHGRSKLVETVNHALQSPELQALSEGPPGPYWAFLNEVVMGAASEIYCAPSHAAPQKPADAACALARRAEALQGIVQMLPTRIACDFSHLHDLQRVVHAWSAVVTLPARQRREDVPHHGRLSLEFQEAWSHRKFANVRRVARSLAHRALRPKRRRYDVPLSAQPDAREWSAFFQSSGPDGGCCAEVLPSVDSFLLGQTHSLPTLDPEVASSLALKDYNYNAVQTLFRKLPSEVWRTLLYPNDFVARKKGLGSHEPKLDTCLVARRLLQGLCAIRKYQQVPSCWQLSQTHKLSKGNGKIGCHALHAVNCLDSVGKCFFKHVWSAANRKPDRLYASGYTHAAALGLRLSRSSMLSLSVFARLDSASFPVSMTLPQCVSLNVSSAPPRCYRGCSSGV